MDFDKFIENFYLNYNGQKMILNVDIDNKNEYEETNLYDIHTMLFDLFIAGVNKFNLDFINNLDEAASNLQYFYNNINIKLNIIVFTKKELIMDNSLYINRYIKTDISSKQYIINGQHQCQNDLNNIHSFYLIDDSNNICISFEHADL